MILNGIPETILSMKVQIDVNRVMGKVYWLLQRRAGGQYHAFNLRKDDDVINEQLSKIDLLLQTKLLVAI